MNTSRFDPSFFPGIFPVELLPLAAQLELAIYTSDPSDLYAPPMGGWYFVGPAGLSHRELKVKASWHATIPEAIKERALILARFLKSQAS